MKPWNKKDIIRSVGPQRFDRRTLLRGALAGIPVCVRLPVLDGMLDGNGQAFAAGKKKLPLRFGVFYWGGGIVHQTWIPKKTGLDWELPDSLQPFGADLQPYLTLVTGMHHRYTTPGHIPSRGVALSSSHDLNTGVKIVGFYGGHDHPEPSVDVLVSDAWKGSALFDSVEVGVSRKGPHPSTSSWRRGGKVYNRHEPSPQRLFDRLFRGETAAREPAQPGQGVLAASTALDKSMLDVLLEDTRALARRAGHSDRERLEQHLEGLRSIERRLQSRERLVKAGICVDPERPELRDYGDGTTHEEKEAKSEVMSDLMAVALACGLTRVFSYEYSGTQSDAVFWEDGVKEEHHALTHKEKKNPVELPKTIKTIMKSYAYLARALRNQREGAGNVLDNTLLFGTSELGNAGTHDYIDHPLLLVGKAGGAIRGGLHHRDPDVRNENAPKVLLTAVRAVGVPLAALGQDYEGRRVTESISELEASAAT
jgi:hypothetical protein